MAVVIILAISFLACNKTPGDTVAPPGEGDPVDSSAIIPGWTMVWNDEFNNGGIDSAKWEF